MPSILDKNAWAQEFLKTIGNANPTPNLIKFVQAWEIQESGSGPSIGCDNNPLNTCQQTLASQTCTGCVQRYIDAANQYVGQGGGYREGLLATRAALQDGNYPTLLHALVTNDEAHLGFNGGQLDPNIAGDLTMWSTGARTPLNTAYVNGVLNLAGQSSLPSGGDIGQVTPAGALPAGAIDWQRVARAGIGTIMLLAGVSLLIKAVSPSVGRVFK